MAEIIKQVALLADIMKGIQEDRAEARVNEKMIEEEGVSEPEEMEPSNTEQKSEASLEKQKETGAVEAEPTEEKSQAEEEAIVAPLMYDMTSETLEEVKDEPQGEKREDIIRCKEFGASLFYLQVKTEHAFEEKAERHVPEVEGENAQGERPPSVIDKPDRCYDA